MAAGLKKRPSKPEKAGGISPFRRILAGNLGQNAKFKPTPAEPVRLYVNDFDDNGQIEQVLSYYVKGREIPFANHAEIMKQIPTLKKKYLLSKDFAKASIGEVFGKEKLSKAVLREADNFQSMYFENTGAGLVFKARPLPDVLQWSTLNAAMPVDLNGDGQNELLLGGNFYESNIEMGRYDANHGNVLSIGKDGAMTVSPLGDLRIKGQIRRIRPILVGKKQCFVLARNNETAIVIAPK
jgi:enediyne biosynthesis protein E4